MEGKSQLQPTASWGEAVSEVVPATLVAGGQWGELHRAVSQIMCLLCSGK